MTDLTDTSNNKAVNGNVAVCDDVAMPDITTTAGPNHPRANLNKKTNGKASGKSHIPGRANQDMHWRSKVNREITKQKYIDSAKANDHSPGKGPSHSEGISLSEMTPSQTMTHTIEISKVVKGKDRTFSPASPDSDVEPTPPIPKTAPKPVKKKQVNKSSKSVMPNATGNATPSGPSSAGTQGSKHNDKTRKHQFPAFLSLQPALSKD